MATVVTMALPTRSVQMLYSPRRGNQPSEDSTVAHSTWVTKVHVSLASENTISALMRMDVAAAAVSATRTRRSVRTRRRSPLRSSNVMAIKPS